MASPAPLLRLLSVEELIGSSFSKQSLMAQRALQLQVEPQAESTSRFEATSSSVYSRRLFVKRAFVAHLDFLIFCVIPQAKEEGGEGGKKEKIRSYIQTKWVYHPTATGLTHQILCAVTIHSF